MVAILFWVFYVLCWVGGFYFNFNRPAAPAGPYNFGWALPLILIGLLGYAVFHFPAG